MNLRTSKCVLVTPRNLKTREYLYSFELLSHFKSTVTSINFQSVFYILCIVNYFTLIKITDLRFINQFCSIEIVEEIVVDVLYYHKTKGKKEAIHNILSIYSELV